MAESDPVQRRVSRKREHGMLDTLFHKTIVFAWDRNADASLELYSHLSLVGHWPSATIQRTSVHAREGRDGGVGKREDVGQEGGRDGQTDERTEHSRSDARDVK